MADRVTDAAAWAIIAAPVDTPIMTLAEKWGVSPQSVRIYKRAANAKAKKMVAFMKERGDPVHLLPAEPKAKPRSLSDDQVREIRTSDMSSAQLASKFGCSASMVRMVRTGKTYTDVKD